MNERTGKVQENKGGKQVAQRSPEPGVGDTEITAVLMT